MFYVILSMREGQGTKHVSLGFATQAEAFAFANASTKAARVHTVECEHNGATLFTWVKS